VALAEAPSPAHAPSSPRRLVLATGTLAALLAGVGAAFLRHAADPRFRSPEEVLYVLDVPVLAALPPSRE
jgi:capsular polysaccharide biosynthesis protein